MTINNLEDAFIDFEEVASTLHFVHAKIVPYNKYNSLVLAARTVNKLCSFPLDPAQAADRIVARDYIRYAESLLTVIEEELPEQYSQAASYLNSRMDLRNQPTITVVNNLKSRPWTARHDSSQHDSAFAFTQAYVAALLRKYDSP